MTHLLTKEIEPGRWIAATGISPYICIEAETEAEAVRVAEEGLAFYDLHRDKIKPAV